MLQPVSKPAPVAGRHVGTVYRDAVAIFLHESVLDAILEYSALDIRRELGGFLVGGYYEDGRPYVEARRFLPAIDVRSKAASLTFTHDTWARLNRQIEEECPGEIVVGWHHTHPNLGVFLSEYDRFIHRNFFSQPWQIALVVDPCRCEFGFYQWRGAELVNGGFLCLPD